jgi:hypothetical protein
MHSIIKHDRVSVSDGSAEVPSALPARGAPAAGGKAAPRCRKSVQLLREKDVVHAVEVRCSCGETTVIELEYGPEGGAGA